MGKLLLGLCQHIGQVVLRTLEDVGHWTNLSKETIACLFRTVPLWNTWIKQMVKVGVQSLPVVLITGAFVGMVLAYISYFELNRLGVASLTGPLIVKALVKQLGPVLAGVMLAGRVGCAMTAELGTMAVTEQIDALRTMGANPIRYLVLPRVVAFTIMTPILTAYCMAIGIVAGLGITIYGLGVEAHFLHEQTRAMMVNYDYFQGLLKATLFGFTTAIICCYRGLVTSGGAEGVGKSTTDADVASCVTILVVNLLATMVMAIWE